MYTPFQRFSPTFRIQKIAQRNICCMGSYGVWFFIHHFLRRLRNMAPRADIFPSAHASFFCETVLLGMQWIALFQLNQQQINDCIYIYSDDYTLTDFKYSKCNMWVPSGNDIPFLYQSHRGAQRTAPLDHLSNVTAAKQTRSERMPACAETRGKFKPQVGQRSWSMNIDKPW